MNDGVVKILERSEEITDYRVKIRRKPSFQVTGYTLIVPPNEETLMIPQFVRGLETDGRMATLKKAASAPGWILGLGSWDEACQPGGMRYTMCVEETEQSDLGCLLEHYQIYRQRFEACEWMCFEIPQGNSGMDSFWKDAPYKMLRELGYRFHLRVGVHFDAFPIDYPRNSNHGMEFWISVAEQDKNCDICPVREDCGKIQPFN